MEHGALTDRTDLNGLVSMIKKSMSADMQAFQSVQYINIEQQELEKIFAYGVNALEYVTGPDSGRNLYRKPLHPI